MMFKSSKKIPWWNLTLEKSAALSLQRAFRKKYLSNGPLGPQFQDQLQHFLNIKHAHLTTSGSSALLIALKILGIRQGDEVIVPNRTFQATAHAPHFLGATLVCAEVDPERGVVTTESIQEKLSERTKAIIVVHLNGRAVDMDPVMELARAKKIPVIEDAAQAFGSTYKGRKLGSIADIGCFSFGVTKFLTMGQGGAIVCHRSDFSQRIRDYLYQGQSGSDQWRFDTEGFNFRTSNLLVALALPQFKKFETNKKKFLSIYRSYQQLLSGLEQIKFLPMNLENEIPVWVEVLAQERDELFHYLKDKNIETVKFYPSVHEAAYLKMQHLSFPHSALFSSKGLILPSGLSLKDKDVKRVAEAIRSFYLR